uniref:Pre-PUA domain-containing protein n=1 Tax=Globodera rostochiensis TaxID=31243 RepID=A0A914I3Q8_GLORO
MFRKHFTVKSYTNLRHSERKTIFSCAINSCFNAKQQVARVLVTLPTSNVCLYVLDKEPLFFQCPSENTIFPTVYFLWSASFDGQFPVLFVHAAVLPILQNGSDLMLPGILLDHPFADFEANAPVAIAIVTEERGAPVGYGLVAVGQALISSSELRTKRQAGEKGKAIKILHIYGDFLWEYGSKKLVMFGQKNAAVEGCGSEQNKRGGDGRPGTSRRQRRKGGARQGPSQKTQLEYEENIKKNLKSAGFTEHLTEEVWRSITVLANNNIMSFAMANGLVNGRFAQTAGGGTKEPKK